MHFHVAAYVDFALRDARSLIILSQVSDLTFLEDSIEQIIGRVVTLHSLRIFFHTSRVNRFSLANTPWRLVHSSSLRVHGNVVLWRILNVSDAL